MNIYSEDKMYESYSSEVERMQKCIDELQQENQKYKEVIDKTTEYCDNNKEFAPRLEDILDILKEAK